MRKGLSAFKLVPQRRKHRSVHKKPLSPKNPFHRMSKNHCHIMPKKRRSWCLPIEPWAPNPKLELQNVNCVLQICTVSSNSQAWAPIRNPVLQWTYSQIHKNLQIELNYPKRVAAMSKYTCHLLLYIIIYYMFSIFIIYYFILYVFIICYFILYKLP